MKKITILSLAALSLLAVSCKKDYTCSCTKNTTFTVVDDEGDVYGTGKEDPVTTSSTIKDKEDDAKSTCESGSSNTTSTESLGGGFTQKNTTTTACTIQ